MTPDPFRELTIPAFGGLNLTTDPQDVGWAGAVDLSNLAFDQSGQFRARDGYTALATTTTAPQNLLLHLSQTAPILTHIVTSSTTKLEAFNALTGAAIASGTVTPGHGPHALVTYGKPGASAVYACQQQDTGGLRKWSGTAWSQIAGTPAGRALGVWQTRLVVGGTTAGDESTVFFSNAGDPETFGASNWEKINPDDGDYITSIQAWENQLFVFKQRRFAVFTGVSTLSDGSPEFNYYELPGVGALDAVGSSVSTPRGVYFVAADGLYLTNGGPAVRVDGPVAALFGTGSQSLFSAAHLAWSENQLFVGTASSVYVYYQQTDRWSKWTLAGARLVPGTGLARWFFVNGADSAVHQILASATTDNGTAIAWSYTSGYNAVAGGQRVKLRGSSVWGTATNAVTLQILTQGGRTNDVVDPGGTVTLGTAPTVAEGKRRRSCRGVLFAHKLSGSGPASVSRITHRFMAPEPSY